MIMLMLKFCFVVNKTRSSESCFNAHLLDFVSIQIDRPAPAVPERVAYYDLEEVAQDAKRQEPWVLLHRDGDSITLGLYDSGPASLRIKVIVRSDLAATIVYEGIWTTNKYHQYICQRNKTY